MNDAPRESQSAGALFDVEEFEASANARHHEIADELPDDLSPAERLLRGGLPVATSTRWQPLRLGLVNLYLFDNEVFPFADGRLLLRGDNGAGKSRVLALTLPLLLDGRLHPTRVEPDRDSNRQVAWNLLMDEHPDRTGYTWIEFGRIDDDGTPRFLTLGIGMRGVRSRGITDHWMFMSDQRIGQALSLITPERRVATRRVLVESLGEHGQLFESSRDYRRAVDEALFRLGDRYEALLDLLLQLRQPQLAKKLDLAGLEAALIQAMPPISQTLLSDAADAFRSLDQERETLDGLQQARLTVQEFLRPYRRHLRLGIRRAAGRLRSRQSRHEQAGKELREADQNKLSLDAESMRLAESHHALVRSQKAAMAALQTLQADPAIKYADRLRSARQLHDAANDALANARSVAERLQRETEEAAAETQSGRGEFTLRTQRAEKLRDAATKTAAPDALRRRHADEFARLFAHPSKVTSSVDTGFLVEDLATVIDEVEASLSARVAHWKRTGEHLAELHQRVHEANDVLRVAVRRLDDTQDRLLAAADSVVAASQQRLNNRDTLQLDYEDWWTKAATLSIVPEDPQAMLVRWNEWSDAMTGPSPVVEEADSALRRLMNSLAVERSDLRQRQEALSERRNELNEELEQLHGGAAIRPTPFPGRDPDVRRAAAGSALWEVIEFVPGVPHDERAGWEAALESSGLLDAWLHPDGTLIDPQALDTALTVTNDPVSDSTRRLSRVLMPANDCRKHGLEPQIIGGILDRIGSGIDGADVWVDASGRWQNGPLSGRRAKPIPQYIGEDVRSAWRTRRIAELDETLNRLVETFAASQAEQKTISEREQTAIRHRQELPDDGRLRSTLAECQAAERLHGDAQLRVNEAAAAERTQRQLREDAVTARDSVAHDVGLAEWNDRPSELLQRISVYHDQLGNCVDSWRMAGGARDRLQRCLEHESRKNHEQQEHAARLPTAEQTEQSRLAALDELQRTVGVDAREITDRIAARESELAQLEVDVADAGERLRDAEKNAARLEAQLEQFHARLQACDESRREAADALTELADVRLLPSADSQLEDVPAAPGSLTATVELARRIEKLGWRVADVDDEDAWKRSQTAIYNALEPLKGRLTSFSMNAEPEFLGDHICRVQVRHEGDLVTPDLLVRRLQAEVDEHERVLSEKERSILEKHLLGEVAGELHERMQQAADLVDSMNREVSGRPMRTGMQMRFRWEADTEGPAGITDACQVLSSAAATWSDDDRRELGDFLQRQIVDSREQDDAGSRLEQLAAALDYRRWHRLWIDRRAAKDQHWKPLTRRTYGSGSGGEKAIALTLPQVAAAAAYYRTADPLAPRLILMDEVFAGISTNNRAACLELLTAFELDVVMTSESEWGCYSTVPQLAICQLTRVPDLAAIDNTLFIWNGKERTSE